MALKAVHVSNVPHLHEVPKNAASSLYSHPFLLKGVEEVGDEESYKIPKFLVIGHRGSGMNIMQSSDQRMKSIKENSILSFNSAGNYNVDFIEFDVQVTKDGCPVIFHDNFILTEGKGTLCEKRVTDLTLAEFRSYGPRREPENVVKPLYRKTKDGRIFEWKVETDDPLCTLVDVFQKVEHSSGFNVELKFDEIIVYKEEELLHAVQTILKVVFELAKDRPIIFSSFQPDAALLIRKLQSMYPVFFLTNGGSELYIDTRRNSLDEAIKLAVAGGLQGIVSEVKAILRNPGAIPKIKESKLSLITYGQLNNSPELVYVQKRMGVEGVIVDLVHEIPLAVSKFTNPKVEAEGSLFEVEEQLKVILEPHFPHHEPLFLAKHVLELIQT